MTLLLDLPQHHPHGVTGAPDTSQTLQGAQGTELSLHFWLRGGAGDFWAALPRGRQTDSQEPLCSYPKSSLSIQSWEFQFLTLSSVQILCRIFFTDPPQPPQHLLLVGRHFYFPGLTSLRSLGAICSTNTVIGSTSSSGCSLPAPPLPPKVCPPLCFLVCPTCIFFVFLSVGRKL